MPNAVSSGLWSPNRPEPTCAELSPRFSCHSERGVNVCDYTSDSTNLLSRKSTGNSPSIYHINGVWGVLCTGFEGASRLGEKRGTDVTLIHNDTEGRIKDLLNAGIGVLDSKDGLQAEPAALVLAENVLRDLKIKGKPIVINAHSQGGIITRNALDKIRYELGLHKDSDWQALIRDRIYINVIGSGTAMFDDIPKGRIRFDDHKGDIVRILTSFTDVAGRAARAPKALARWIKYGEGQDGRTLKDQAEQVSKFLGKEWKRMKESFRAGLGDRPSLSGKSHALKSYLAQDVDHATLDVMEDVKGVGNTRQQGVEAARLLIRQRKDSVIEDKEFRSVAREIIKSSDSRTFRQGIASELLRYSRKVGNNDLYQDASEWLYGVIKSAPRNK